MHSAELSDTGFVDNVTYGIQSEDNDGKDTGKMLPHLLSGMLLTVSYIWYQFDDDCEDGLTYRFCQASVEPGFPA